MDGLSFPTNNKAPKFILTLFKRLILDVKFNQTLLNDCQVEINNHEPRIDAVSQTAQHMVEEGHFATDDIKGRLGQLHDHWNQLKEKSVQRKQDLEDSLQAHQYFTDANEAESWLKEKEPLAGNVDFGKDEDASEALLKRHEAFMSDLEAFGNTIQVLDLCFSRSIFTYSGDLKSGLVWILNDRIEVGLQMVRISKGI